ncbi:hypothetical protein AJ79_02785 [Helicocarpus griseus UAMH5409]|uniref:Uncharacterized protein n=1 Tax=Helicocarpus griseus UAMH5409 TaxID=1447875 RepID=A0A2B7Y238_9EURO|nr:hypothetical protein AJ79_02785 [Helicocarpus griseus UAMH5409]
MTTRKAHRYKPPLLVSKSLEGLEKVIPPQGYSPSNPNYMSWKFDKPLPDLPRPTSSIYSPEDDTGLIESHIPPCPRNTMLTQTLPRVPSRAHSLGSSEQYQKALQLPADEDGEVRAPKKTLSLQPYAYPSDPNLLFATNARGSLAAATGPYHPDLGWTWAPRQRRRSNSTRATHGSATTADHSPPILSATIDTVDPMLLPAALYCDTPETQNGKDESSESSMAVVDDSGSETCHCEISENPRRRSEEAPNVLHIEQQQRIMWLPSTGHLPTSKLTQDGPLTPTAPPQEPAAVESVTRPRYPETESQTRYGNRTELYSFSSSSSEASDDDHNLNITPTPVNTPTFPPPDRRRTRQLAVPISDYQRYGSKSWKPKRDRRPSTMLKRKLMKTRPRGSAPLSASSRRSTPPTPRCSSPRTVLPLPPSFIQQQQYQQQSSPRHSRFPYRARIISYTRKRSRSNAQNTNPPPPRPPSSSQPHPQQTPPSSPFTYLPRRMKTLLTKAFQARQPTLLTPPAPSTRPSRPPRPPSPSPINQFLPPPPSPPRQQQQQQEEEKQRSMRGRAELLRRSVAVTRERLGLGLSCVDFRRGGSKERVVVAGPTDLAGESSGWV